MKIEIKAEHLAHIIAGLKEFADDDGTIEAEILEELIPQAECIVD